MASCPSRRPHAGGHRQGARRILNGSLDSHYFSAETVTPRRMDFLQRWRQLWREDLLLPGLAVTALAVLFLALLSGWTAA